MEATTEATEAPVPRVRITCPVWYRKVCYPTPDQASLALRRMFYNHKYREGLEVYICPYGTAAHLHLGNRREWTRCRVR